MEQDKATKLQQQTQDNQTQNLTLLSQIAMATQVQTGGSKLLKLLCEGDDNKKNVSSFIKKNFIYLIMMIYSIVSLVRPDRFTHNLTYGSLELLSQDNIIELMV